MTDFIIGLLGKVIASAIGLLPHLAVPSWLSSGIGAFNGLVANLAGTQGWLPWDILALAIGVALAAAGVTVAIRGTRIVLSFLTLGGGS